MKKRWKWLLLFFLSACTAYWFCLPDPLFTSPASTIAEDRNGELLAARIAADGQWRFPERKTAPEKFITCITYFEDEYFLRHPGINPFAMMRAMRQNWDAKKIVSGGSTLSMQVIRLARRGKPRTMFEKIIELILATRLELRYSKAEILALYASHTPFGGNVVGLDAASWRYFGREPEKLSWGETATLAVLPNAPSLIYPGKNHEKLLAKRNRLLEKLMNKGVLDEETCHLTQMEPLPGAPLPLPNVTPHLLARLVKEGFEGERITTAIDISLQKKMNAIADKYHKALAQNDIHNTAILVVKTETGEAIAYVGNSNCEHEESGTDVDIIVSPRSSGSILKPLLYAAMLDEGELLPNTLVADIPTHLSGYAPKNFDKTYDGAVAASNALTRSLNIPAVRMLRQHGTERFHEQLNSLGFTTINQSAGHYGLSLILGGAEVTLWDAVGAYSSLARTLSHFNEYSSKYYNGDYKKCVLVKTGKPHAPQWKELSDHSLLGAAAVWEMLETLSNVTRPREERGWDSFVSSRKVAWKTGTSFGHRDAWAIGITPEYVEGVWAGNADGEGRPGLTGANVAGPILFDVFKNLPATTWFRQPFDEMTYVPVCKQSGSRASVLCEAMDSTWVPKNGLRAPACSYHRMIHLDQARQHRVTSDCYPVMDMQNEKWFVLPPVQEWYYKNKDPNYRVLPPLAEGCRPNDARNMEIIYPETGMKIFIPRLMDGSISSIVFEAAHRVNGSVIYWHIDDSFTGTTMGIHKMELAPLEGSHRLTLVDNAGEETSVIFEIVEGSLARK